MSQQICLPQQLAASVTDMNTAFGGAHQTDFQWTNGDISRLKGHSLHSCIDKVPIRSPAYSGTPFTSEQHQDGPA